MWRGPLTLNISLVHPPTKKKKKKKYLKKLKISKYGTSTPWASRFLSAGSFLLPRTLHSLIQDLMLAPGKISFANNSPRWTAGYKFSSCYVSRPYLAQSWGERDIYFWPFYQTATVTLGGHMTQWGDFIAPCGLPRQVQRNYELKVIKW